MKEILLSLVLLFGCVLSSRAFNDIYFHGLPFGDHTDAEEFMNKLESQGFAILKKSKASYHIAGEYDGYECDNIFVGISPQSNKVSNVMIFLPELSTWSELKDEYNKYKTMYDKKYSLKEGKSYFEAPYNIGDGKEYEAVKEGKCHYWARYFVDGENDYGDDNYIYIEITKFGQIVINIVHMPNWVIRKIECESLGLEY